MKIPHCRVQVVGELTDWGTRFLSVLEQQKVIEVGKTSIEETLEAKSDNAVKIFVIENSRESQNWIKSIRSAKINAYILWIGRVFSKEDLNFAIDNRVYSVFEQTRPEDPVLEQTFQQLCHSIENETSFSVLLRSLKSLLLQIEGDVAPQIMHELRSAASKLAKFRTHHEFLGHATEASSELHDKILFHKSESLSEALLTIHSLERTGVLWVRSLSPRMEGRVTIFHGKPICARVGDVMGTKAMYRMFLWNEAKFLFARREEEEVEVEAHEEINLNIQTLVKEGEEQAHRYRAIQRELPPPELDLEVDPKFMQPGASLSPDEFSVLSSVVEFRQVDHVLNHNPLPDTHVYEGLILLRKRNLIRIAS